MSRWTEPCTGPYANKRKGAHRFQRGARGPTRKDFCTDCGLRDDGAVEPTILAAYNTALAAFMDACEAFNQTFSSGHTPDQRFRASVAWRNAWFALKAAEAEAFK